MKASIWITTDWHFGHHRVVEKGYRPADYEDRIEKNLLRAVMPGDTIICLGDVSLYPAGAERAKRLLALLHPATRCCLVRGNHDSASLSRYRSDGWDWVCDSMALDWGGARFTFSHEPRAEGDINIHGHLHAGEHREAATDPRCVLIALEFTDYRPVNLETILALRATPEWHKDRFRKREGVAV